MAFVSISYRQDTHPGIYPDLTGPFFVFLKEHNRGYLTEIRYETRLKPLPHGKTFLLPLYLGYFFGNRTRLLLQKGALPILRICVFLPRPGFSGGF